MARINPDPYAGGHAFVLLNRVTGLVDTEEEAMVIVQALEAGGVPGEDIDVFVGHHGAQRLDLAGREHGTMIRLLRRFESAVGDECAPTRRIEEAMGRGASLVCVKVHDRYDEAKQLAFKVLETLHGYEIHYWGPFAFEDVRASGPCALCALPSDKVMAEDEHVVWTLDPHPITPGHSLIIPKRHIASLFDATLPEREAMLAMLARAREHAKQHHSPAGYNIGFDEGAVAGQYVPHLHVHLIPRYKGDGGYTRGGLRWVIPDKANRYWSH